MHHKSRGCKSSPCSYPGILSIKPPCACAAQPVRSSEQAPSSSSLSRNPLLGSHSTYFGDVRSGGGTGGFRCDRLCTHQHAWLQICAWIHLKQQRHRPLIQVLSHLLFRSWLRYLRHYDNFTISYYAIIMLFRV